MRANAAASLAVLPDETQVSHELVDKVEALVLACKTRALQAKE